MRRPHSIITYLLVGVLVVLVVAQAAAVEPSNVQTSKTTTTKWDAGQKDLLASMEGEAARAGHAKLDSASSGSNAKDEPMYVTFLSFVLKLAAVVALAYGTIYALKRFNVSTFKRSNIQGIKVVENTSLGANRTLHVVEVGGRRLLVASTPSQVNLLTELEVDSVQCTVNSMETTVPSETVNCQLSTVASFRDQLSMFMGARPNTSDAASNVAGLIRGSSAFLQEKIVELGRLRGKMRDA